MAVKAAIIGLGRIGSLLEEDRLREKPCTHAGAIAAVPGLELCAGSDINQERCDLFKEKWQVPVYTDAQVMLQEEQPSILHIATHPDSHWHYCSLAKQYGVSVVVCEKPLADTLSRAKKIAALHNSGNITIITNHERRYADDYKLAKKILNDEKQLGPIIGIRGTLYMGKGRRLLDVLWHDGTHMADAAMFLSGSALKHKKTHNAKGLKTNNGTVYLYGHLYKPSKKGKSNIPFLLELGGGRDHLVFMLEISCEWGKLLVGNGIFEVWESKKSPYAEGFKSLKKNMDGFTQPTGYFSAMAADAFNCVDKENHKPLSSAVDGLRVIQYLHSIKSWN